MFSKQSASVFLFSSNSRYLRKTTLNNPKKTRLSLCYVKKKLYFCTRKIKAKRVRGSKNRQKRDFDVKNQLKK